MSSGVTRWLYWLEAMEKASASDFPRLFRLAEGNAATSGLALFALGKHGGRELNYSSDIDIVAFFDPERAPLRDRDEATKFFTRVVQKPEDVVASLARVIRRKPLLESVGR